jgi:hypothetical protein
MDKLNNSVSGRILSVLPSPIDREVEVWVVNSVKVAMIKRLDLLLEGEGRLNARKLFLTPEFTISGLKKRVEEQAPEIKTLFFRELVSACEEVEKRLSSV